MPTILHADQIGHVPLFGAGPRRYIRSRLFRLGVTVFWRALTASWQQKGKRKQVFPRAIRTTELPSNPSPLRFRNNQIQNLTDLFDTRNHGSQRLSASHQHTRHVVVTRTHAHTTRDEGTKALTIPRRPPVRAARQMWYYSSSGWYVFDRR